MIISRDIINSWRWRIAKADKNIGELADATGISGSQISNYLNGRTDPSFEKVCKIESVLASWGVEYQV
jgi:transcriptional regulator with XRE-family HTH domain